VSGLRQLALILIFVTGILAARQDSRKAPAKKLIRKTKLESEM